MVRFYSKQAFDYLNSRKKGEEHHNVFHFDCPTCYPLLKKYSQKAKDHILKKFDLKESLEESNAKCLEKSSFYQDIERRYKREKLKRSIVADNIVKSVSNLIKSDVVKTDDNFRYYEKVIHNSFHLNIKKRHLSEDELRDDMLSDDDIDYDFLNDKGQVFTMSSHRICKILMFSGEKLMINEKFQKSSNEFKRHHYEYTIEDKKYYVQYSIKKYNKYFVFKDEWQSYYHSDRLKKNLPKEFFDKYELYYFKNKIRQSIIPHDFTYLQENFGQDLRLKNALD